MEGRQNVDIQEYIRDIIDRLYFKSQAEADRYLKLHYETVFGIYDHNSVKSRTNKPSSPIYHHPGLSAGADAVTHELLIKYRENRIHDVSKMTFLEYIMLPRSRF